MQQTGHETQNTLTVKEDEQIFLGDDEEIITMTQHMSNDTMTYYKST